MFWILLMIIKYDWNINICSDLAKLSLNLRIKC